ncbi:MAG: glycosyltransferase family 39 protein [Proteobacteria bacterium]|nr:glycosyltransferase family 39 protein [Pseudomonadota bacterium]
MSSGAAAVPRAAGPGFGLWLWLLLGVAWLGTIGVRPLLDPDEGRYAEIPREMLVSGDWVTPRFNDLKYFEKPPLQYWATAAVYEVGGVRPWTSRLWGVGLAFACLPLVYAFTRRLYGERAALAGLAALAVSPFFLIVGHLNLLDQAFTFFLSAALFAFVAAQSLGDSQRRPLMLLAWGSAALAVLSKGIVVGVLCGGSLVVYTLLERDARPWRRLAALPGLALFSLIAVPWFVLVSLRNPSFPGFFFVHEHFARFLTTVHQRVEPWWFFLPLLLLMVLPWIPEMVRALRAGGAAQPQPEVGVEFKPLRFLLIYCALTLAFFSASGSKLVPYILPLAPPLAVVAGVYAVDARALVRRAARIGVVFVVILAVGLVVYSARRNGYVPQELLLWCAAALLGALLALFAAGGRRDEGVGRVAGALALTFLAYQCLLCAFSIMPPARSAAQLVSEVRPYLDPQLPLYSVGQYRETLSPYLGRTLILAGYEGELAFGLGEEPQRRLSVEEFADRWSSGGAAVAFFEPEVWDEWRRRGLPGRVIAADYHTVAVSRL